MLRVLLLTTLLPFPSFAQTSPDLNQIRDRLVKKPLYLKNQWASDHLRFDADGRLQSSSTAVSYTLSGFDITSVQMKNNSLVLKGFRAGIKFTDDRPKRVQLRIGDGADLESMDLSIASPPDGDFGPALDRIFYNSLEDLAPTLPSYWQAYVRGHLPGIASAGTMPQVHDPCSENRPPDAGAPGTTPPVLVKQPDPAYSSTAKAMRYNATVLIGLDVSTDGKPTRLCLRKPAGFGLDEQALAAVSEYRFRPAIRDGKPLVVTLNVDVKFQLF